MSSVVESLTSLRSLQRAALLSVDDVADQGSTWFVLTYPEGGLELGRTPHNELVLWAYTHFGLLVDSCGIGQPYVRATLKDVTSFVDRLDAAALIALNVWHPDGARYPEPDIFEIDPLEEAVEPTAPTSDAVVWIPTRPVQRGDRTIHVELHHDASGHLVVPTFTTVQSMLAGCGPYQAASAIRTEHLGAVAGSLGAEVALDPVLAESARRTAPVRNWRDSNLFN